MRSSLTISLLCAAGALLLASCNKAEEVTATYTLSVQAGIGEQAVKALEVVDNEGKHHLKSTWGAADHVKVFTSLSTYEGSLSPDAEDYGKSSANLTGSITGGTVEAGKLLLLRMPAVEMDYTGQDGSLSNIAAKYDYASSQVEVESVKNGVIKGKAPAVFQSEQAIVKFILKDCNHDLINPTSLTLDIQNAAGDSYIYTNATAQALGPLTVEGIDPSKTADGVYVALNVRSDDDFTPIDKVNVNAADGKFTYSFTRTGRVKFEKGKYYEITLEPSATYVGEKKKLSEAKPAEHLGWVVDKDGFIYSPADAKRAKIDFHAVIVYFDENNTPGKRLCMAISDMEGSEGYPESNWERACSTDAQWYTNWVGNNSVAGYTWKVPSREEWANLWRYRNVLGSETFPVHDLLSAAGASLADNDKAYYWTSTSYDSDQAFAFQIYDFEGLYEKVGDEYQYGFLDAYIKKDRTGVHTRYVFTF